MSYGWDRGRVKNNVRPALSVGTIRLSVTAHVRGDDPIPASESALIWCLQEYWTQEIRGTKEPEVRCPLPRNGF